MGMMVWLKGLLAAVVGGTAAGLSAVLIAGMDLTLPGALTRLGIIAAINAIVATVAYCMKSPIPIG